MRKIHYLWFWKSCWDENRKWTLLFSLMIPLAPMGIFSQIFRLLTTKRLTTFSNLLMIAVTAFINEFILKSAFGMETLEETCYIGFYVPSTYVAICFAMAIISFYRYIAKISHDLSSGIIWTVLTVLTFISRPILNYLTWGMCAVSFVPGLVIALVWIFFVEKAGINLILMPFATFFSLRNDINGDSSKNPQDLMAK